MFFSEKKLPFLEKSRDGFLFFVDEISQLNM